MTVVAAVVYCVGVAVYVVIALREISDDERRRQREALHSASVELDRAIEGAEQAERAAWDYVVGRPTP